ncbi:MAG TPA: ribosomal protein S18-alanine N-acetyltransferase [Ktedonobacterales bacterium]
MRFVIEPMRLEDIPRVAEIERICYTTPWPSSTYRREIEQNPFARYIVARDTWIEAARAAQPATPPEPEKRPFPLSLLPARAAETGTPRAASIIGFAGLWLTLDEAHVTTIAVHPQHRGQSIGELMLSHLIVLAYRLDAEISTLEVRVSNSTAQNLYRKYGYKEVGIRRRYYSDNNEDAFIMTTDRITSPTYRERFEGLRRSLRERLDAAEQKAGPAPTVTPAS